MTWDPATFRQARQAKGWSRSDFARLVGVSPQAVEKWETGLSKPSPANARRISEALTTGPGPQTLGELRDVVALQAQVLRILVAAVVEQMDDADELVARLAALEVALGRQSPPSART